jgi:hypothetical protein
MPEVRRGLPARACHRDEAGTGRWDSTRVRVGSLHRRGPPKQTLSLPATFAPVQFTDDEEVPAPLILWLDDIVEYIAARGLQTQLPTGIPRRVDEMRVTEVRAFMHAILSNAYACPLVLMLALRRGRVSTVPPSPSILPVLQVLACPAHARSVERDRRRRRQHQQQADSGEGASQAGVSDGELSDSEEELRFVQSFTLARKPSNKGLYKFLTRRMRQLTDEPNAELRYCILCAQKTGYVPPSSLQMVGPCWKGCRHVSFMHCAFCSMIGSRTFKIKTNSSGNINKHLKEKHPDAVAICTGAAAVQASDDGGGSTTASQTNTSQRLSDMWSMKPVTKRSKIVLDLAYTIHAIDTNTPFQQTTNAFARHCFYRTMTTLRAQFTAELPSIETQKNMVRMMHEFFLLTHKEKLRLAQEDIGNPFVSVQFDFWTDPAGRSFGALNFSILDSQFNIQRGCLGCGEMDKRHTAERIAEWVRAQLGACRPCMY